MVLRFEDQINLKSNTIGSYKRKIASFNRLKTRGNTISKILIMERTKPILVQTKTHKFKTSLMVGNSEKPHFNYDYLLNIHSFLSTCKGIRSSYNYDYLCV